ncbi:MAG TPA: DUF2877 domain-containing protein [Acidimicrobiia bacterium]
MVWARPGGGAWLRLPDAVVGLAPPGAPLGPTWIRRAEPWPALAEGDTVVVDSDGLRTADGPLFLDRRHAVGWLGPLPDNDSVSAAAGRALLTEALASFRPSVLSEPPWSETVEQGVAAIGRAEPLDALKTVARALGGLGPGLTPAGDDALSGILFAFRALGGPTVEPALLSVARSVRTSDLAAAVLEAAAGGFHIEPVHDLVTAAATGDHRAAANAAADLDRYGSSSGADIAYGLRLAFTHR